MCDADDFPEVSAIPLLVAARSRKGEQTRKPSGFLGFLLYMNSGSLKANQC